MNEEQKKQLELIREELKTSYKEKVLNAPMIDAEEFEIKRPQYKLQFNVSRIEDGMTAKMVMRFHKISGQDKSTLASTFRDIVLRIKPAKAEYFQGDSLLYPGQWEVSLGPLPIFSFDTVVDTFIKETKEAFDA